MIKELVMQMHWSFLPVVSMGMFISVFLGALIWVFRRESNTVYTELQSLPLSDEPFISKGDQS